MRTMQLAKRRAKVKEAVSFRFRLPADLAGRVDQAAADNLMRRSDVLRQAVKAYLDEPPPRI